jgi:hypothetical protein
MKCSPWLCALAAVAVAAATACDSGEAGSGVDSKKTLGGLSSSERDQLCSFFVSASRGPRTQMCGSSTVQISGQADCIAELDSVTIQCTARVADAESCGRALGEDACSAVAGACTAWFACLLQGG